MEGVVDAAALSVTAIVRICVNDTTCREELLRVARFSAKLGLLLTEVRLSMLSDEDLRGQAERMTCRLRSSAIPSDRALGCWQGGPLSSRGAASAGCAGCLRVQLNAPPRLQAAKLCSSPRTVPLPPCARQSSWSSRCALWRGGVGAALASPQPLRRNHSVPVLPPVRRSAPPALPAASGRWRMP